LIDQRLLESCHDLSQGGLGIALAEACFSDYSAPRGARLALHQKGLRPDALLFAESGARFLISCSASNVAAIRATVERYSLQIAGEGAVGGSTITVTDIAEVRATDAFKVWFEGLEMIFSA
jgi:phosphoribosylformylglycinamidine synthase